MKSSRIEYNTIEQYLKTPSSMFLKILISLIGYTIIIYLIMISLVSKVSISINTTFTFENGESYGYSNFECSDLNTFKLEDSKLVYKNGDKYLDVKVYSFNYCGEGIYKVEYEIPEQLEKELSGTESYYNLNLSFSGGNILTRIRLFLSDF